MFPNTATSSKTARAVAGKGDLIATTSESIIIHNVNLQKSAEASQLVQCSNGTGFYTIVQAIGTSPQEINGYYHIPSGWACYLRTFDNTLTQANITWSPDRQTPMATTSNILTLDGQATVYFFGILLFIAMLYFFKDIFKVERYD